MAHYCHTNENATARVCGTLLPIGQWRASCMCCTAERCGPFQNQHLSIGIAHAVYRCQANPIRTAAPPHKTTVSSGVLRVLYGDVEQSSGHRRVVPNTKPG